MPSDSVRELGAYLTAAEAAGIAAQLAAGEHTSGALMEVSGPRREQAKRLLSGARLGHVDVERSVAVLSAIAGAKSVRPEITPVWTMPGNEADRGRLTGEFHRLVGAARLSVTCATYNFTDSSQMWSALGKASEQPGVSVTVYVDAEVADADDVKQRLPRATVYRSAILPNGFKVRSHAKFIVVDHTCLLLTSANFSQAAEKYNVELGLVLHEPALALSVEEAMSSKHGTLYELIC